jgi:hypothetical protein
VEPRNGRERTARARTKASEIVLTPEVDDVFKPEVHETQASSQVNAEKRVKAYPIESCRKMQNCALAGNGSPLRVHFGYYVK